MQTLVNRFLKRRAMEERDEDIHLLKVQIDEGVHKIGLREVVLDARLRIIVDCFPLIEVR